jgi:hypothetical protein
LGGNSPPPGRLLPGQVSIDLNPDTPQRIHDSALIVRFPNPAVVGIRKRDIVEVPFTAGPSKVATALIETLVLAAANPLTDELFGIEDVVLDAAPDVPVSVPVRKRRGATVDVRVDDLANLNLQVVVTKCLSAIVREPVSLNTPGCRPRNPDSVMLGVLNVLVLVDVHHSPFIARRPCVVAEVATSSLI